MNSQHPVFALVFTALRDNFSHFKLRNWVGGKTRVFKGNHLTTNDKESWQASNMQPDWDSNPQ